jgi:hypothetical protein
MRANRESVVGSASAEPRIEVAVGELDDPVALLADEVVMVALAAEAVADLASVVHQRIDGATTAEGRKRPVDRCEADTISPARERGMDLLRGGVVPLGSKGGEDGKALARRP